MSSKASKLSKWLVFMREEGILGTFLKCRSFPAKPCEKLRVYSSNARIDLGSSSLGLNRRVRGPSRVAHEAILGDPRTSTCFMPRASYSKVS